MQVLTLCVMSNHFHVLWHVPKRPRTMPDDAELVRLARVPQFGGKDEKVYRERSPKPDRLLE